MNINLVTKNISRTFHHHNVLLNCVHFLKRGNNSLRAKCECSTWSTLNITSKNSIFHYKLGKVGLPQRHMSEQNHPSSSKLPPLMNFPKITWPSLIKSVKNFILATFIIKPYFDRDFTLGDFVTGSKKALEVVSQKISEGDIKSLDGLVANDIVPSIQKAISLMSLAQREEIALKAEDVYFSFPYQIGIMFEDNDKKRFVEITMVFHALRGLAMMRERGEEPPYNMGMLPEYQHRLSVCNYRFIREFTKGVDSDWTINLLNHFKPIDEFESQ